MSEKILHRINSTHVVYSKGWIPKDMSYYDVIFTDQAGYIINKDDTKMWEVSLKAQIGFLGGWLGKALTSKQRKKNQALQHLSLQERLAHDRHAHRFFYHEVRKFRRKKILFSKAYRLIIETEKERYKILIPKDLTDQLFRFLQERCPGSFV